MRIMRRFLGILGVVLLAVVCVGIAELSVARIEDPALYESVTAPAWDALDRLRSGVDQRAAELEAERLEQERLEAERIRRLEEHRRLAEETVRALEIAAQEASAPAITETLTLADPAITTLTTEGEREILTGGNVRLYYYNQSDEVWAEERYGNDSIRGYGCGPTALAMVIASMTGEADATPASVAAWAAKAGYCSPRSGSYLSIVQGAAEHYGLACESLGAIDADTLYARLSEGGVIVALMGPGHFTAKGHFILLHGVTLSGEILVADPNSRENSLAVWEPQVIIDELSPSRHDGAPLWRLTTPFSL